MESSNDISFSITPFIGAAGAIAIFPGERAGTRVQAGPKPPGTGPSSPAYILRWPKSG